MALEEALLASSPPLGTKTVHRDEIDYSLLPAVPKPAYSDDGNDDDVKDDDLATTGDGLESGQGTPAPVKPEADQAKLPTLPTASGAPSESGSAFFEGSLPPLPTGSLPPLPGTELSKADDGTPAAHPLLIEILQKLVSLSPGSIPNDRKNSQQWFPYLVRFVQTALGEQFRRGLAWRKNWLRQEGVRIGTEDEGMWWRLEWEEKVHLMRVWCDWCLCYSADSRGRVEDGYDLGKQRVSKRRPYNNHLIIEAFGTTINHGQVWALDNSYRIYSYKAELDAWSVLASTKQGYHYFTSSLLKEVPKETKGGKNPFNLAKEAAAKAVAAAAAKAADGAGADGAEPEKKKPRPGGRKANRVKVVEGEEANEVETRRLLVEHLGRIKQGEDAIVAVEQRRIRAAERAADKDARLARQLEAAQMASVTRGDRLRRRTQLVNYIVDAEPEDAGEDELDREEDEREHEYRGSGRKRRKVAEELDYEETGEGDADDDFRLEGEGVGRGVGSARKGRGGGRKSYKEVQPGVDDEDEWEERPRKAGGRSAAAAAAAAVVEDATEDAIGVAHLGMVGVAELPGLPELPPVAQPEVAAEAQAKVASPAPAPAPAEANEADVEMKED